MSKRILAIVLTTLISISLIGCGKSEEAESKKTSDRLATEEKYTELSGTFAEETTIEAFKEKFNSLLKDVEDQTKTYGLKYDKEEETEEFDTDDSMKSLYIYLDQEKPELNRLESLYFGMTLYGASEEQGQITMKTSLNFDGNNAIKDKKFDFGDTSLATYSEIFTGIKDRDYSEINKKILEVIKSGNGEGVVSDSIEGLYEEFTITKNYIVYTLETKVYDFVQEDEIMK